MSHRIRATMPGRRSFSSTPMAVTGGDSTRVLPFRSRGRLGRRTEPGSLTRRSSGQHREMVTSTAPSTSPASTEPSACGLPPMARHLRGPRPDERSRTWQPATFRRTRTPGLPGSASSPRPSVPFARPVASTECSAVGVAGPPTWSPDGTKIAMATRAGVCTMTADGKQLTRLSAKAPTSIAANRLSWSRPSWQPR